MKKKKKKTEAEKLNCINTEDLKYVVGVIYPGMIKAYLWTKLNKNK